MIVYMLLAPIITFVYWSIRPEAGLLEIWGIALLSTIALAALVGWANTVGDVDNAEE